MSAFQPYIDQPYPDFALEEARRVREAPPVPGVTPANAVRPVETEEGALPPPEPRDPDSSLISNEGRAAVEESAQAARRRRDAGLERFDPAADVQHMRDNRAVRELVATFSDYDNREAVKRFSAGLDMFVRYGGASPQTAETDTVAGLRARENLLYHNLGLSVPEFAESGALRNAMMDGVDRWLEGGGVFMPAFLHYPSSDGFRFAPLSGEAELSSRAAEVMAGYERARIASYLRELSALTPADFLFYDPTGLGDFSLSARREFLHVVDGMLLEAEIALRAAELRYILGREGRLTLEGSGLENVVDEERLEQLRREIAVQYEALHTTVPDRSGGIISEYMT